MAHEVSLDDGDDASTPSTRLDCDARTSDCATAALQDAHWYATRLINDGWVIRRIGVNELGGFFVAETPGRRVISVAGPTSRSADPAAQFANCLTALATAANADRNDYIGELLGMLEELTPPIRRPATLTWCTWPIPGVTGRDQPIAKVRAAYWFAVTLTEEYGWRLCEFGMPAAGGGFIADIPAEATAIFPASICDDGTTASALARLLAQLNPTETDLLAALVRLRSAARSSRTVRGGRRNPP